MRTVFIKEKSREIFLKKITRICISPEKKKTHGHVPHGRQTNRQKSDLNFDPSEFPSEV
jgi:hypothetical protein